MNASELFGRPVLDLATATTVGRIDDVVVDPNERQALGVRLAKSSVGDWLAWDDISAIGPDAVTISGADLLGTYADEPSRRPLRGNGALGGRVLTDQGREIGALDDVDLADDGAIVALVVGASRLDADDLLGVGTYATVVRDTVDRRE